MQADESPLLARIGQARADLCQALAELDHAVSLCKEAKQELTELLELVDRMRRGDFEALKPLSPECQM